MSAQDLTGASPNGSAPRVVEVAEDLTGRYTQTARVGPHTLTLDEPVALGGGDLGPGPYDLLLMGLGACTAMTLRMYAERKGLPLQRVRVRLTHRRIHVADCADCESLEGQIAEISRDIELEGPLTPEERARLIEIANRCPVHRTLTSEIKIRTREVVFAAPAAPATP